MDLKTTIVFMRLKEMKLKKTYTLSVEQDLAEEIEKLRDRTKKSYTELFVEAMKNYITYWNLIKKYPEKDNVKP